MNRPERVLVVLPAYNEAANIGRLVERIDQAMSGARLDYRIVAVDDGSTDGTSDILEHYAGLLPLEVCRHTRNQGLGVTIRDGLLRAAELVRNDEVVVTMDADESHAPGLIPRMLQMVREGHDLVIASRYVAGARVCGVPLPRRFLSFAASWLFRAIFRIPGVRDYTCGYRVYSSELLKRAVDLYGRHLVQETGFQCMVEVLLKLRRLRPIVGEAPLILRYDMKRSSSKMQVVKTIRRTIALSAHSLFPQRQNPAV